MPYTKLDTLLKELERDAPAAVNWLVNNRKVTRYGLLPVGLKIHSTVPIHELGEHFVRFVQALDGASIEKNYYKLEKDAFCLVLPPVGSAEAAITLIEAIERATKSQIFENQRIQIQVCSPGRLDSHSAGMLTLASVLGSDYVPKLGPYDVATTFSRGTYIPRGVRIAIYDGEGELERRFRWWRRRRDHDRNSAPVIVKRIPFRYQRTDILTATSQHDIRTVNLVATLLVHQMKDAYWSPLGHSFARGMERIVTEHQLQFTGITWVNANETQGIVAQEIRDDEDMAYWDTIAEIYQYLDEEAARVERGGHQSGVLYQVKELIDEHRALLVSTAQRVLGEGRKS